MRREVSEITKRSLRMREVCFQGMREGEILLMRVLKLKREEIELCVVVKNGRKKEKSRESRERDSAEINREREQMFSGENRRRAHRKKESTTAPL
ncbi:hypothetical protein [Lyngbya confervoides]|uniref:Uncharacterized protein n=1 Tax=Lyngbya confervoides BDU141951 TaxID=1574623 RepID=A0ABD4T1U0_9CYAN|nr:hypothetical protein [Lyngbya confervoides]MCM1982346.1 hypothetical protein [Lyngbya confervoides BDU141951]